MEVLLPSILFRFRGGDNRLYVVEVMELLQTLFVFGRLQVKGSTRRIARDSLPSRPACWIQTDSSCGVMNWMTSLTSGICVPCNGM